MEVVHLRVEQELNDNAGSGEVYLSVCLPQVVATTKVETNPDIFINLDDAKKGVIFQIRKKDDDTVLGTTELIPSEVADLTSQPAKKTLAIQGRVSGNLTLQIKLEASPVDKVLDRLAREVLMVDEKGQDLSAKYREIIRNGLPNPLPKSQHNDARDVLIVGAGIAGLVAGRLLKNAGYNVTILEANDNRVGGRVKTFHTAPDRPSPFQDPQLYAEAGAMRIPSSHPLVNELIDVMNLSKKKRPFYNVDVSHDGKEKLNHTWIRVNSKQPVRYSDYLNEPDHENDLDFPIPAIFKNKTANDLLKEALADVNSVTSKSLPLDQQINGWKDVIRQYDQYSMQHFLVHYFQRTYPQLSFQDIISTIQYIGTVQNLTSRLFLSFFHSFVDTKYINADEQYVELEGGNWQLPYAFVRDGELKENIIMNARAVEMQWTAGNKYGEKAIHKGRPGAYVRTVSHPTPNDTRRNQISFEREFTADHLVVAIPFSTLRLVEVSPAFSYEKRRSIIELHYDSATKVLLEFTERFWEWDEETWKTKIGGPYRGHNSVGGGSITDSINRFIYYPSHPTGTSTGGIILASYTWSDDASRWDAVPDNDRYGLALQGLISIYGEGIKKYFTGFGNTQSWMRDKFSLGEAAVFSPGQFSELHQFIESPEGNVHFAGEHASLKHAWIEGAIESAVRVALEIHHKWQAAHGTSPSAIQQVVSLEQELIAEHRSHIEVPKKNLVSSPQVSNEKKTSSGTKTATNTNNLATNTVASYLKTRFEQLGLTHLFTVAGNYVAPLLNTILDEPNPKINITGISNEICAGYAADAYAKRKGIGAVAVTYGVGAFSLLNAIAGSSVEHVPVVVINGAPTNKEFLNEQLSGLLYSHMTADPLSNLDVYRRVTVSAERILSANQAPAQIDAALTACITYSQPVYLEVAEDVWRAECPAPVGILTKQESSITRSDVQAAVKATVDMMTKYSQPIFWAGVEIQRMGLQQDFLNLVAATNIKFITSALSKSVVSEDNPHFVGVMAPQDIKNKVKDIGCLVGLGAWTTGKDTNNQPTLTLLSGNVALAAHNAVIVGTQVYPIVHLKDFIHGIGTALAAQKMLSDWKLQRPLFSLARAAPPHLTYDAFFGSIDKWLTEEHIVVSDASFPLLGAAGLHIREQNGFVAQASWLAIGYSTPAAIGVKCADPSKRPVVIVGDGAFQETCQAISSHSYLKHNTVVFVLANGVYGVEQKLVNPNPFRQTPVHYKDKILNDFYSYNNLHEWSYDKLTETMGGVGKKAATLGELLLVLKEIKERPDVNFVVEVVIPKNDAPSSVQGSLSGPGEDETEHPQWPPALLF